MLDKNITKKLKSYTENLSILFVDDEEAARESIYGLLKTLFKNVYIAENGQEGLNIFEKEYPDIVLTDLRMPIMDGLKMIEEIRKIKPEQKIVAQSAHGDSQIILETVFMGIDGYILKPIKSDQIINTLYKIAKLVIMEKENTKYRLNLEELVAKQVDQIKQQTESLINQLRTDHLTRLPNKEQLNIDFKEFSPDVMIFLNIDNFDQINLYYGFEVGDLLLIEFASFLRKLLDSNKLYRINGDEFAILIKEFTLSEAKSIAENIHNSIYNNYFLVNGLSLCITVTIGIIPIDKTLKKPPFGNAHLAIKKARETHKNSIEIFKPEFILELKRKKVIEWTQKAKIALDSNLYQPFFQPIINLKSNKIEKYECLARIVENESVDSPYLFIEPAKKAGILPEITKQIIEKSFAIMANTDLQFSINITEDDLKEEYLLDFLNKMCELYSVKSSYVILEILENINNNYSYDIVQQLKDFKKAGFRLAIDDFGTENSNFTSLLKLDVDFVKIDGSFIKDIDVNIESQNIVKTIVYYANLSGIKTIAEYVHSKEVLDTILLLGVDYAQGYYFGKPEPEILDFHDFII